MICGRVTREKNSGRDTPVCRNCRSSAIWSYLRLRVDRQEFSIWLALAAIACLLPLHDNGQAATHVDSLNLVSLTVTPTPSSAAGHLTWQFEVTPLDDAHVISSIDVSSGVFGFAGSALRQVHPSELPTAFPDFNPIFPSGEDASSDSQFAFVRSSLTVVPNSIADNTSALEAAFTGFEPIAEATKLAHLVLPFGDFAEFSGAFVVRPMSGGLPRIAEFHSISIGGYTADFDNDGDVDSEDLHDPIYGWEARFGNTVDGSDFLEWQRQFTGNLSSTVIASVVVPEPSGACSLLIGLLLGTMRRH